MGKTREQWLEEAGKSKAIGGCAFLIALGLLAAALGLVFGPHVFLGALAGVALYIAFTMRELSKKEEKKAKEAGDGEESMVG